MPPLTILGAPSDSALVDLPWTVPLEQWPADALVGLPRGVSRHVVRFVRVDGTVYAVKEAGDRVHREYRALQRMRRDGVPCVAPVGVLEGRQDASGAPLDPVLVTRHLTFSLPYRALFAQTLRPETASRLLDALAVLLVRLHLAGWWWGDCSLSNTLFRRDAGAFAAYLVDAETAERHDGLSDGGRRDDLDRARTNVVGELLDLAAGELFETADPVETGASLASRYDALWEALTAPQRFGRDERYKLDQRIRGLNELGFDVAEIEVRTGIDGQDLVEIRPKVVDPGHHSRRLLRLTGLDAQENQARRLLNDLDAYTAARSAARRGAGQADEADRGDEVEDDEEMAAHRWLNDVFATVVRAVPRDLRGKLEMAQVFHEVLVHRWYLSERAGKDVGTRLAAEHYVEQVLRHRPDELAVLGAATPGRAVDPVDALEDPHASTTGDPHASATGDLEGRP